MPTIESLSHFYKAMHSTIPARKRLTEAILGQHKPAQNDIENLKETLADLEAIPRRGKHTHLELSDGAEISIDIDYELEELQKDLIFLERGEEALSIFLKQKHTNFTHEVNTCIRFIKSSEFRAFISDRDGTVNNYCGRYASSVQSVYNAVFLTRYAKSLLGPSIILTSAPLDNIGLADISVCPDGAFIYAGSKGREYFDQNGNRRQLPIPDDQQDILVEFNEALQKILSDPAYTMFSLIGSGLQFKFGQTTIARQDISKAIPEKKSKAFLEQITTLIQSIDKKHKYFRIEDTGLDIEIILTINASDGNSSPKDFDKGDGVRFLDKDASLDLANGPCLVCGDTKSDLPMVRAAAALSPKSKAIFVTQDKSLQTALAETTKQTLCVSSPDILVSALNGCA